MSSAPTWDIFCKVIDNFGDIGVCWRFARQLAAEQQLPVRLWVDDLETFRRINGEIDPAVDVQSSQGVEVWRWTDPFPLATPADVVVETFGCEVPASYQAAMAERARRPVWINLEYLSAEDWVNGCHGLPSPHPKLPLVKHYFFPGFGPGTGGLIRERGFIERRRAFQQSSEAMADFWQSLQVPAPTPDELRVSLFGYENPALPDLLRAWAAGEGRVSCLVPESVVAASAKSFFTAEESFSPRSYRRGNLEVRIVPFLTLEDYDRLLWACRLNFVRGEDSFVRGQWAARPFVWHIYPQKENTHWVKLNAFLDHYCADMPADRAASLRDFCRAWVSGRGAGQAWAGFRRHLADFQAHASRWADRLEAQDDLTSNLVRFCDNLLK